MLSDAFHGIGGSAVVDEVEDINFVGLNKIPYELMTVIRVIVKAAIAIQSGNAYCKAGSCYDFSNAGAWMWRRMRGTGDWGCGSVWVASENG